MSVKTLVRRLRHEQGGFTLVEMLAAVTILLTVFGTLTVLMVSATKSEVDLTLRVQAQQEARLGLEKMRRDVHCTSTTSLDLMPNVLASVVTLNLPVGCPSAAGLTEDPVGSGLAKVTWCTSTSSGGWALYRVQGAACTTVGARREAQYLTQNQVFVLRTGADKLAKLCTVFPIDVSITDTGRAYRLRDALVLRNSSRGTAGTQLACPT